MRKRIPVIRVRASNGFLVGRDGLILCFFMRHSHAEVAPTVWRALQMYLRAIPPQTLSWYIASEGGFLPLDDGGWRHIHGEMLERPCPCNRSVMLQEECDGTGGYNFHYYGRRLDAPPFASDENSTCAVSFTLPTEYLVEHGPDRVRDLALGLARELPFSFGYASLALISPNDDWIADRPTVLKLRDRYPGLDFYDLELTSRVIGTRARGTYWLTFLGQPLLGQLGGTASLRQQLAFPDVSLETLPSPEGERVLVTLDEWPEAIDTAEQERPSPQLLALARLLEPFLYPEDVIDWFHQHEDKEDMRRWIRRFCP